MTDLDHEAWNTVSGDSPNAARTEATAEYWARGPTAGRVRELARAFQARGERIARLEALVRSLGKCSWCCGDGYCEEYVSDVETERYQCGRCAGTGLVEAARKELL